MDKILVEIYVPAANADYDVLIPLKSKLYDVVLLVSNTIAELSNGYFVSSKDSILCDKKTGTVLDINKTVEELQLMNGSKLMLL